MGLSLCVGYERVRQRFAKLAKYLPFLPVFGGGKSLFQPVSSPSLSSLPPSQTYLDLE
jgi:hypothetical protein